MLRVKCFRNWDGILSLHIKTKDFLTTCSICYLFECYLLDWFFCHYQIKSVSVGFLYIVKIVRNQFPEMFSYINYFNKLKCCEPSKQLLSVVRKLYHIKFLPFILYLFHLKSWLTWNLIWLKWFFWLFVEIVDKDMVNRNCLGTQG